MACICRWGIQVGFQACDNRYGFLSKSRLGQCWKLMIGLVKLYEISSIFVNDSPINGFLRGSLTLDYFNMIRVCNTKLKTVLRISIRSRISNDSLRAWQWLRLWEYVLRNYGTCPIWIPGEKSCDRLELKSTYIRLFKEDGQFVLFSSHGFLELRIWHRLFNERAFGENYFMVIMICFLRKRDENSSSLWFSDLP